MLLPGVGKADPIRDSPAAIGSETEVVVKTMAEEGVSGRLQHLSTTDGVILLLPDGTERRIPITDVVRIETGIPVAIPAGAALIVDLQHGDRIIGTAVDFGDEVVQFRVDSVGIVSISLDRIRRWRPRRASPDASLGAPVRAARFPGAPGRGFTGSWTDPAGSDFPPPAPGAVQDAVQLTNGDTVRGIVVRIDRRGFLIETDAGEQFVPNEVISVVDMVPAAPRSPMGDLTVRLRTVDGSVLTTGRIDWLDGGTLRIHAPDNALELPVAMVAAVEVTGSHWVWLTSQSPTEFRHTPMFSIAWPYRIGRNVRGGPIRVAGRTYDQGIGVHSASALTYELGGQFRQFVTHYGLDDNSGLLADVAVEIRIDGEIRHRAENVVVGTLHGPVRIDVRGAQRLELIVQFGRHGAIQDRFDWVESALIR